MISKSKIISFILLICLLAVFTTGCSKYSESYQKCDYCEIKLNTFETFDLHTEDQNEFLKLHYSSLNNMYDGSSSKEKSNKVKLSWSVKNKNNYNLTYNVDVSLNEDFTSSVSYSTKQESINLLNLYLNSTYYWRVNVLCEEEVVVSVKSKFNVTTNSLRNLNIDSVKNMRDLGGYVTSSGETVKQGMIYRSGCFNQTNLNYTYITLSQDGLKELNKLNLKSEIDLRQTELERGMIDSSPLSNATYYNFPMTYDGNILKMNETEIKEIFKFLSNAENYPVVIHCNIGTDRTGAICFLLEALLGVDVNDIYHDYLFSNLASIGSTRTTTAIDNYLNTLKCYKYNTLSTKASDYLLSLGVTEGEILNIKNILLN